MNSDQRFAWFRLFSVENLNSEQIQRLRVRAQINDLKVSDIFDLTKIEFDKVFSPDLNDLYQNIKNSDEKTDRINFDNLLKREIEIIYPGHEFYPEKLLKLFLYESPPLLFAKGNTKLFKAKNAAIVGSRNASREALNLAGEISKAIALSGWNVVSGYARGIDSEAHIHALFAGGTTTMVLPLGINKFVVRKGFKDIVSEDNSLILSQFHPESEWQESNGLERNKLMVGLSQAVIVIQAIFKGGSLFTGGRAIEKGIPLFVMSPKRLSVNSDGNAKLIAKGGIEFCEVDEIVEKMNILALN